MAEDRETTHAGSESGPRPLTRATTALAVAAFLLAGPLAATAKEPAATAGLPVLTVAATLGVGHHPEGVAIHPGLGLAVTANRNAGSVSLVSLATRSVVGEVVVGLHPVAVAVNPLTDEAVVANAASHTVSIVSLRAGAVTATIPVGRRPVAVAIDPERHLALVANRNSGTVSVIDLGARAVLATLDVGRQPSGVAVNPATGQAAVTNRGDDTLTLIDLTGRPSVTSVVVLDPHGYGRRRLQPTGIAWDTVTNTLAVANTDDWSVSLVALDDANLVAARVRVAVGKRPVGIAVSPGNDLVLVTSDQDDVLALSPSAGALTARADVGKHPWGVAIAPGGDGACAVVVTNREDNSVSLLGARCDALTLVAIDPSSVTAGARSLALTLIGTGFTPGSVVNVGSFPQALTPSALSPTRIGLTIPAAYLAVPATLAVSVTGPGGARSNALPLAVSAVPPPVLTALAPPGGVANFQDLLLTVIGTGFLPGATIVFEGQGLPTVVDGPTQAHATVPAGLVADGRAVDVTIENPGRVAANVLVFALVNPLPVLSEVTPNNVVHGAGDTEIVLLGNDFVLSSQVFFCPTATSLRSECTPIASVPFVANPPVQINARIPAALLGAEGVFAVRVFNPEPGGGESFNQPFTVTNATLPPGYTLTVLPVAAGHPERVTRVGPSFAVVALPGQGQVQFVDLAAKRLDGLITLTSSLPSGLLGDLDGDPATGTLVVAVPFKDRVDVVQVDRLNPAASPVTPVALPAGAFPFGVAVNPATHQAVVVNIVGASLSVVDLPTRRLLTTIPLPGAQNPTFVTVNPATNVAVVVDQGDFTTPGQLFLVDLSRSRVSSTVTVEVGPSFVAVNPATNRAVVSNSFSDTVSIVDLGGRGAVLATIPVGQEPTGVAIDPAANQAMVAHTQNNQIMFIDLGTFRVSTVLQLGADGAVAPSDLAWDAAAKTAIATNATIGAFTNNLMILTLP